MRWFLSAGGGEFKCCALTMQDKQQEAELGGGGSAEVRTLLSRHKASLARELKATNLLGVLLKRGVITELDRQALLLASSTPTPDQVPRQDENSQEADVELFIELIQGKGFEAFREFCFALEAECPHVLTDLLVDQHAITGLFYTYFSIQLYFLHSNTKLFLFRGAREAAAAEPGQR